LPRRISVVGGPRLRVGSPVAVMTAALTVTSAIPVYGVGGRPAHASGVSRAELHRQLRVDLVKYLRRYRNGEHISAASLTVSAPGHAKAVMAAAGTTRFGGSSPVGPRSMRQIGSNTKAFHLGDKPNLKRAAR